MIHMKHVTVRREGKAILSDISLDLHPREHVAIIGPNGSGKSTLVQVITKEVHPIQKDDFELRLFGKERWHIGELRKHVGIVSDSFQHFCNTTYCVKDIVTSGLTSTIGPPDHTTLTPEMHRKAQEVLHLLEVEHLSNHAMNTLSSGESQRVLTARALITNTDALLLDEAVSNLDFLARKKLRNIIEKVMDYGKHIIMVTHDISEIPARIDRIILMKHGTIIADGPKKQILTEAMLSEAYNTRVFVSERDGILTAWC